MSKIEKGLNVSSFFLILIGISTLFAGMVLGDSDDSELETAQFELENEIISVEQYLEIKSQFEKSRHEYVIVGLFGIMLGLLFLWIGLMVLSLKIHYFGV